LLWRIFFKVHNVEIAHVILTTRPRPLREHSLITRLRLRMANPCTWAPPGRGKGGHLTPLDFDINFPHIYTVAPRVEIQMHFWKGAKFAGSVGHPMTKMLSASGGFRPPDPQTRGSAPGLRWGLCRQTPVIGSRSALAMVPPQPLTPSPPMTPWKQSCGRPCQGVQNLKSLALAVAEKLHGCKILKRFT